MNAKERHAVYVKLIGHLKKEIRINIVDSLYALGYRGVVVYDNLRELKDKVESANITSYTPEGHTIRAMALLECERETR